MAQDSPDGGQSLRELIAANDHRIFSVASETSIGDRKSLLRLQNLIAAKDHSYVYYEVGSHLGGTLVPHLLDPRCRSIISIDPRPQELPDERGHIVEYRGNSTERMIKTLRENVPAATLGKLKTFELDAANVPLKDLPDHADLIFIDGEHTNAAAFSDFLSLYPMLAPNAIVAFHDANLTCDAILNIERFLKHTGVRHEIFFLPDCVGVAAIGEFVGTAGRALANFKLDRIKFDETSRQGLNNLMIRRALTEGTVPLRTIRKGIWRRVKRTFLRQRRP